VERPGLNPCRRDTHERTADPWQPDGVLRNQTKILVNQRKLDQVLTNQKAILANQRKLEQVLRNQKRIEANQGKILANQAKLLAR
jgi:hypothetical protein